MHVRLLAVCTHPINGMEAALQCGRKGCFGCRGVGRHGSHTASVLGKRTRSIVPSVRSRKWISAVVCLPGHFLMRDFLHIALSLTSCPFVNTGMILRITLPTNRISLWISLLYTKPFRPFPAMPSKYRNEHKWIGNGAIGYLKKKKRITAMVLLL